MAPRVTWHSIPLSALATGERFSWHVQEASGDGFASIDLDNKDTQADLAQYFAEQHATRRADEDPRAYITNTLLPYLRAYRTLLTMELPADSGGQQLPLEARASLSTLLRWAGFVQMAVMISTDCHNSRAVPVLCNRASLMCALLSRSLPIDCQTKKPQNQASDQTSNPEAGTQYSRAAKFSTWRPAAVAIIRELSRDGMLARSGKCCCSLPGCTGLGVPHSVDAVQKEQSAVMTRLAILPLSQTRRRTGASDKCTEAAGVRGAVACNTFQKPADPDKARVLLLLPTYLVTSFAGIS